MSKILILSCSTGQGHDSCAAALQQYFTSHGNSCETADALSFISDRVSQAISWGHSFMYRYVPKLFRYGYKFAEEHPKTLDDDSEIYKLLTISAGRLREFILSGGFDAVLCTHIIPSTIISVMQREERIPVTTAYLATDYAVCPGLEKTDLDYYFVPAESLISEHEAIGIAREKIVASGIPVRQVFREGIDKAKAKSLLGVNPEKKHLIVMCGSMGAGPMYEVVKNLSELATDDIEISVICGKNELLQRQLQRSFGSKQIFITGYTREVPLYMGSADLYFTKPGGISTTESSVKRLPMVLVDAVAGCEEYNLNYFTALGAAKTADKPAELAELCISLLHDEAALESMKNAYPATPDAREVIYKTLVK